LRGASVSASIGAVFGLLIALPLALVLVQALVPGLFDRSAPSLALDLTPLRQALSSPRVIQSIVHSLELAGAAAVAATILGGGLAVLVQRTDVPGRRLLASLPWVVFLVPSYLKALAWVLLMSPGGYLAQLGILPESLGRQFFGLSGLIFVHTVSLFPMAAFIIGGALAGLGSELEDAARIAGISRVRIWYAINLPLLAPALVLSTIVIFAEVLSDFGMASTIARLSDFGMLTYGIYAAASNYPVDFPMAGSQALVLLLLVVAVVFVERQIRRSADPRLISGRSRPPSVHSLGQWRWPAGIIGLVLFTLAVALPLAAVLVRALSRTLDQGLAWDNLTAANIIAVIAPGSDGQRALLRSLGFAAITAAIACAIALWFAIQLDASRRILRPVVLGLSLGSVAIPGIVLAFGYILVWNGLPLFRDWPFPRYGDGSLLVTGYVAAALPYCLVVILAATNQLAPSLFDAARLHGVTAARRLGQIMLPLILLSLTTAFLLTFIRTVFELPVSQLLIPLSGPPLPPLFLKLFSHDRDGPASALAIAAMVTAGALGGLLWLLARRFVRPDGREIPK
jgi:iron(III) transport system permease protein